MPFKLCRVPPILFKTAENFTIDVTIQYLQTLGNMTHSVWWKILDVSRFLSSPIECVAFQRLELLRTEITGHENDEAIFLCEKTEVPMVCISTYGMYKYL